MAHTEGPWRETGEAQFTIEDADGAPVVWAMGGIDSRDNARLIAAAPAWALAWALVPDDIKGRIFNALHKPDTEWVEEAIRKATG